ncbi:hypothetical protein [Stenotrophomonas sp. SY1]|uniref:hypothetical protein n=1 Tax=Stenotrophomonas sp. SY1 TaxID=477235 RepID=UPI001E4999DA|nr:hypothetical protein [Stenotrophomonas sp. SY1]MCD9086353.1 hypothetical protein [Stenotrophomonas sp. SY1]
MNDQVLSEVRDLLIEQNRLMAHIVAMNEKSMAQAAAAFEHNQRIAAAAQAQVEASRREARRLIVAVLVCAAVIAGAVWYHVRGFNSLFG